MATGMAGFGVIFIIIYIAMFGVSIYSFVLFIKLARRGIRALDIFIDEKTQNQSNNNNIY